MKYSVLLFGANMAVIEDFFNMGSEAFEFMSCSIHFDDIINHLKNYNLDIMIYCLNKETRENMAKMVTVKKRADKMEIPFIIIGSQEDCDDFQRAAINIADLIILKPSTVGMIREQIAQFMRRREEEQRQASEAEAAKQREQEEENRLDLEEKQVAEEERARLAENAGKTAKEITNTEANHTEEPEEERSSWRKHILIVDDDPHMLKVLKHHLGRRYDVATAVSGIIALRFLQKKRTDLILLDYAMPKMDGPAVLEQLHANPKTANIPVLFLTGASDKDKIQKALALNPQGYLLKPVDQESLLARIKEQLGK